MQSVDGDTAQVPPQVAEDLGIAHIAYATSFSVDKKIAFILNGIQKTWNSDRLSCNGIHA